MTQKQRGSKFAGIISAARHQEPETEETETITTPAERTQTTPAVHSQDAPALPEVRRGRPATGKRSDPSYEQVTAYVKRTTYRKIKIALLEEDDERDFSDLVEELLGQWLAARR